MENSKSGQNSSQPELTDPKPSKITKFFYPQISRKPNYVNKSYITPDFKKYDGLKFVVRGSNLPTMDYFCTGGRIDAYFLIEKPNGQIIYQSEYVKNDLTPVFTSAVIRLDEHSSYQDRHENLVFKWFDWDRFGKDEYIGSFTTSAAEIVKNGGLFEYEILKQGKRRGVACIPSAFVEKVEKDQERDEYEAYIEKVKEHIRRRKERKRGYVTGGVCKPLQYIYYHFWVKPVLKELEDAPYTKIIK